MASNMVRYWVFSAVNFQYKYSNNVDVLTVYSCFYCIFLLFFFANIINGAHRHIVFIAGLLMITSLTG